MNNHRSCPSHCCCLHGCKYAYDDCPVETGKVEQEYPCEICSEYDIETLEDVKNELLFQTMDCDEKALALDRGLAKVTQLDVEFPNSRWLVMKKWLEFLTKQHTKKD